MAVLHAFEYQLQETLQLRFACLSCFLLKPTEQIQPRIFAETSKVIAVVDISTKMLKVDAKVRLQLFLKCMVPIRCQTDPN